MLKLVTNKDVRNFTRECKKIVDLNVCGAYIKNHEIKLFINELPTEYDEIMYFTTHMEKEDFLYKINQKIFADLDQLKNIHFQKFREIRYN